MVVVVVMAHLYHLIFDLIDLLFKLHNLGFLGGKLWFIDLIKIFMKITGI
jgi:hypothetical protein